MSNPVGAQRYGLGGGDAYYDAVKYGGYTGTREQFGRDQAEFAQNATAVAQAREEVERNTQTVVNTTQTFTEETVPAAIQSVEEKGDTEEDRLEARTTELVQSINTAGAVQVQAVEDEGTEQIRLVSGAGTAQVEAVEQAGSDQVDAVEAAGSTQVENVNSAGTTQIGNVNSAGTTQVGNVNTAGATQVQRVQDKGDEVIASIPADYTALDQEVDNLTQALSDLENGGNVQLPVTYTNGGYIQNYLPGNVVEYNGWKYSDYIDISGNNGSIYCSILNYTGDPTTDGNNYNAFYDANKAYVSVFRTLNGEVVVPENAVYARISCRVAYTQTIAIYKKGIFVEIENNKDIDNEYFKIATWNVGVFKDGTNKPTTEEAAAQIVKLRKTVGEVNADILNAQEYVDYVDVSNTISSANLLAFKYANKTSTGNDKCFSKYPIESAETITFTSGSGRLCRAFTINFHGKTITIINYHAAIDLNPSVYREADAAQLIEYMQSKEYCILTGDFNAASDREFNQFTEAGYTLCNGGVFGWFDTWPVMANMPDGWSTTWPCNHLDNIIVSSNIVPQFVDAVESAISDHALLHAFLRID